MTEDAELSMAITFTGHKLYFDERLWFTHDLSGGRVSFNNLLKQQAINGKNTALLYMYRLAYNNVDRSFPLVNWSFIKILIRLKLRILKSLLQSDNRPELLFNYHIFLELIAHPVKNRNIAVKALEWVGKIKNSLPLNSL